ncbi:uncharacterized protein M6B38_307480 [Iris pallida]|uniref:Uncharacterized protein n=1 Tax=Iris pallida TaxID=29817 RepID=A0AAX6HKR7_IRIPA|nr:uncharacterized protein M6B38_199515 [Iris pallida]KAJ6841133.1 uncharacterized protein M6B38_307475 [Iris pallida]KAJ6841134.1 uncharacterized protein M6B38_307480 [Iris pallida]
MRARSAETRCCAGARRAHQRPTRGRGSGHGAARRTRWHGSGIRGTRGLLTADAAKGLLRRGGLGVEAERFGKRRRAGSRDSVGWPRE